MGFLDWMKRDGYAGNEKWRAPRVTRSDRLFAEIEHDQVLAVKRDLTGQEPSAKEAEVPEAKVRGWTARRQKAQAEQKTQPRVKPRERDIPF